MEGDNASGFGVNLIAYIRAEMGLGTAARGVALALEAAKVPFNILNFEEGNPSRHRDESWRRREVDYSSYDFTLLAINPDNLSNARSRVQKKSVKDRYTIGYWFWELPEIPDQWQASFALVDEVWAASQFIQDAISRRSPVPVFRVPLCVRSAPTEQFSRRSFSLPENQFLFLSMGDTYSHLDRKNPIGVIRAFKEAFAPDNKSVGLVLKLNNINRTEEDQETMWLLREAISGHANIHLLEAEMTRSEVDGLLAVCDSFVSLHRSEGFGLGPAEAMSLGKPVILTKWSGNTDYMTSTNSIGIDYKLIPVGRQLGPYEPNQMWADPDLGQAAFWMKRLVEDPEFAKRTGALGQETIRREYSAEAVGDIIHKRLKYLHRAGLSQRSSRTRSNDLNAIAHLQTFPGRAGVSEGQQSNSAEVVPRQWCRLKIDLPWGLGDGSVPFRFDPVDRVGIVDIAAVTLRASATGEIVWRGNSRGGLEDLVIRGTALRLPHERLLRLLSYSEDPQIYLPTQNGGAFEEPLILEVLLRFDPAPNSIEGAVAGWNNQAFPPRQVTSHEAERLTSDFPAAPPVPQDQITLVVYSAGDSGYSEDRATKVTYAPDRWSHLSIALHLGLGSLPLRLDPLTSIGLIEVAALTLRSALDDEVLWRANGGGALEDLRVSGSAVRIPHPNVARILSYGEDPQIYLPGLTGGRFDGPLRLEVWMKVETGLDSMRRGISELATMSTRALDATNHTQGLLEQSNRAFSDKEEQLEASRRDVEAATRQRDETLAQLTDLAREKQALEERITLAVKQVDEAQQRLHGRDDDLKKRTFEVERIRQELVVARNELEFSAGELEKTKAQQRRKATDEYLGGKEMEKLRAEIRTSMSQMEVLSREVELLRTHVNIEQAAKSQLIQQFTLATESLDSAKKDLAVMREAESRPGKLGRLLGYRGMSRPVAAGTGRSKPAKEKFRFWLDSPTGASRADEKIFYAGWLLPAPGKKILAVRALAQDEVFLGQYGFERLDVGQIFKDRPEAVRSAFVIAVSLGIGTHDVTLQFLSEDGKWIAFHTHQHEVLPGVSIPEPDTLVSNGEDEMNSAVTGWLDNPRSQVIVESGLLYISGWAYVTNATIIQIVASSNDGVIATMTHGLFRDDVASSLPDAAASRFCGFAGYLPVKSDFVGKLTLKVEAVLADGTRTWCFRRKVTAKLPESPSPATRMPELSQEERYAGWMETNKLTPYLLRSMSRRGIDLAQSGPLISIIVPTFNTPASYLEELIESVTRQLYPHWQLCLADDASTQPHVRSILERAAAGDSRIDVVFRETNGHIVQASNSALALARGDYVGLLDHDDLLSADALLHVAEAIAADISLDLLYTDEDKISSNGKRYDPIFKGSFSPEMSLTHNYIQHFTVIRRSLVAEIGGFRQTFEGAQDLDLYLRVLEKTTPERVKNLPFVCYHWRSHPQSTASKGTQKTYVFDSARKAITEALERRRIGGARPFLPEWAGKANCCLYQLKWSPELLKQNPVTIVIPTKGRGDLLRKCVASLERTVQPDSVSLIIVDDFSEDESTRNLLKQLSAGGRLPCKVIQPSTRSTTFNFSHLINEGAGAARTPLVLLLNNDTEALTPGWLEEMVGWMSIEGVAAVGAKLLYPDNTVQHAGVIVGPHGGLADHIFHRLPKDVLGSNFLTHAARNVSAVTGACMLVSKAVFDQLGGFDEDEFGMEYNDVDFCLRLNASGRRTVFTPQSILLHHCGQSRQGIAWRPVEHLNFLRRYHATGDPYYNENLDLSEPIGLVNPAHFVHKKRVGKLKVLMISHNLNLEGAPKVLFDHAAYFVKSGGYSVTIASGQDGPLRESIERAGISLEIVEGIMPMPEEGVLAYRERLRAIGATFDAESFDLVICNTMPSFWGVLLAQEFSLPVIWHVHESTTIEKFFEFERLPAGLVDNCFTLADRVVFESGATRRLLSRYQTRGNFETIPGSIDVTAIDRFREEYSQRSMKLKHGLDPDKTVVTLIGTTCPRKGQHVFIDAIADLQARCPNKIEEVSFVMLGARESAYLDLLNAQLATVEDTDTRLVEETPDVFDFYRLTDIFVCASYQESFPRVILEAMAFQLPIVTTDVFGIPEIVQDLGEALLIAPGDASALARAIERLLADGIARDELGARAHAKVTNHFNSPAQLSRQLDLTKEVVARHV